MADKKIKNSSVQDARLREDIASFKSSVAFLLFCAVIFFVATNLQYNRTSFHVPTRIFIGENPWVMLIPLVLFGIAAFFKLKNYKAKRDEGYSYFSTSDAFSITLFILSFALVFVMTYSLTVYISAIIGFALLYYAARLFTKDFMLLTYMNCAFAMILWLIGGTADKATGALALTAKVVFLTASVLTILATAAIVVSLYTKGKPAAFKGNYVPVIISFVIGASLCALLLFAPNLISIMLAEIILLVQYVALGVYYTVRLLNQ